MINLHDKGSDLLFPGGAMRFDPQRIATPSESLFDPQNPALAAQPVSAGGRQSAWFVSGGFGAAVLRHYRRGGMMARVSRDRYLWLGGGKTRGFAEYDLLDFMHRRGLPVNRPLAAIYWRTGPTYRASILVERIPGARPLASLVTQAPDETVARAIAAMHDAGVWHADLNAFNILVDPDRKVWLIDFDKGRRITLETRHRQANLLRLRRSLLKVAGPDGLQCWDRIHQAYLRLV